MGDAGRFSVSDFWVGGAIRVPALAKLVDGLLSAWVKWQQGEKAESFLAEIAPVKYKN